MNTTSSSLTQHELICISFSPRQYFKVVCNDTHGFTFSCPYNQHRLDQYLLGYSLIKTTDTDAADTDFLLCLKMGTKKTFGFMNKGLFVELVNAHTNIYEKLGHLMLDAI